MEVLRGPAAFGIEPAYVREAAVQDSRAAVSSRMFDDGADEIIASGSRIDADRDEVSSASSSSIGTPSDDEEEQEEEYEIDSSVNSDEAESKFRGGGGSLSMASLNSLEDALPIKRGLSSHFAGKSKSFASLADVVTVNDLKKTENPLNKRRRLLIASKWAKKSFYSFANPKSMPLLALQENDDDFGDHDADDDHQNDNHDDDDDEEREQRKEQENHDHHGQRSFAKFHEKRFKSFKARCFSLADLQEHSVLEDDE